MIAALVASITLALSSSGVTDSTSPAEIVDSGYTTKHSGFLLNRADFKKCIEGSASAKSLAKEHTVDSAKIVTLSTEIARLSKAYSYSDQSYTGCSQALATSANALASCESNSKVLAKARYNDGLLMGAGVASGIFAVLTIFLLAR